MPTITPKQKSFIEFIHTYSQEYDYAPSQQEIADHFGWSSLGTVQDYVKKLTDKGILYNRPNRRRALEVNPEYSKLFAQKMEIEAIPIIGKIAAGAPIEAIQESDAPTLPVPKNMLPQGDFYSLEVQGQSMINEGILPGDYILVKKQTTSKNGDTVVALVENEATVKKIYRRGRRVELRPANETMESIWITNNRCRVQGIVVGLYRRYQ